VISLAGDPVLGDPEPACVALQLGIGLLGSKKADVTIFATLGGVSIGSRDAETATRLCETVLRKPPNKWVLDEAKELSEVLGDYLGAGGKIVVCPLCWVARYGDFPQSNNRLIQNANVEVTSPGPLLLGADKVIHYQ
jgi:predicted peroxiredoxin